MIERESDNTIGVSVDSITLEEAVDDIINITGRYDEDKRCRYIGLCNAQTLSTVNSWIGTTPRHPEVLKMDRKASLMLSDGWTPLWLSKILGPSLKERIPALPFLRYLIKGLSIRKKRLFVLGGDPTLNQKAVALMKQREPDLHVVGTLAPYLSVQGKELSRAKEQDALVIEEIHRTQPDVLLLNIGHPKQEVWFERIQEQLNVPVTIAIDNTLSLLVAEASVPDWIRKTGATELYDALFHPVRLWNRYLLPGLKVLAIATPLVLYHLINKLLFWTFYRSKYGHLRHRKNFLFLSPKKTIAVVPIPYHLDHETAPKTRFFIYEALSQDITVLDLRHLRHLDSEGVSLLANAWIEATRQGKELFGLGLTADARFLLKLHRIWDLLADSIYPSADGILDRIDVDKERITLFDSVHQEGDRVILSFFGALDKRVNYEKYLLKIAPMLEGKPCVVDLSYCTYLDSAGMSFLLHLRRAIEQEGFSFTLCSPNQAVARELHLAGLSSLFTVNASLD